jgi:glutamyl-tRNA reductase
VTHRRKLWLVGLSHHSAPVEVREQLAFENGAVSAAIRRLLELPGIDEAALFSTCNRVEVIVYGNGQLADSAPLRDFLARERGVASGRFAQHLYVHEDREAVRHLFRVASSLDSMVVGEPQILGQLKEFYNVASEAGGAGTILHRVFHKAFSVAKRVRTETGIASKNVSIASVAVELASQIFETLEDKTAMLVGAGKMSELTARHLQGKGIGSILFANRTFDRAVDLAREYRGTAVRFEEMGRYLRLADVVIGSTAATDFLLAVEDVQAVMKERNHRPMFLIDLAVPRNFDPRVNEIANVYLYDVDDLEGVLADNRGDRAREAARAEEIVGAEVESFWRWFRNLDVVPTIVEIRERAEEIRKRELERTLGGLSALGEAERRAIEAMTEALVNKLLHPPMARLKRQGAAESEDVVAARRLFGLDDDE